MCVLRKAHGAATAPRRGRGTLIANGRHVCGGTPRRDARSRRRRLAGAHLPRRGNEGRTQSM
eukprot:4269458-Prymnesium_polylepis.1